MKNRKRFALFLALIVALSMLAACTGGSSTPPASNAPAASQAPDQASSAAPAEPTAEPLELMVWVAGSGDAHQSAAYTQVFDAFTAANPHISYELTFIAWGDYFTKLNTGLVGGAGPDLFMMGFGQAGSVYDNGDLLDLTPYIPADWDGFNDFLPNVLAAGQKDGNYYAMFSPSTRVYAYRKDIAEKNGVTEAELNIKTQEDFFNLIRKLTVKDANGNTEMFGFDTQASMSSEQEFFVQSSMLLGSKPFTLWGSDYRPNFSIPEAVTTMESMYNLHKEGYVALRDAAATVSGLQSGVAAMSLLPEMAFVAVDAVFPGQIGFIKNDMNTLLIGNYYAVNAASKYKAESAALLMHMYSKESKEVFAEVMGEYSGRKSLDEHYLSLNPEYDKAIHAYERAYSYGEVFNPKFNPGAAVLRPALESIYHGTPAQKALEDAQNEWMALYN